MELVLFFKTVAVISFTTLVMYYLALRYFLNDFVNEKKYTKKLINFSFFVTLIAMTGGIILVYLILK